MSEPNWPTPESLKQPTLFDEVALEQMFRDYGDKKLPLNLAQEVLGGIGVVENESSWVSSARRGDRAVLSIGLEVVPIETVNRWGWGVVEAADQVHVKVSHEYAHFIQDFFDRDLAHFLDNKLNEIREYSHSYLELYAFLAQTGRMSGLSDELIYREQTEAMKRQGSLLDMQTYEDMAELIGAWMLGEVYYNFRLDHSKTSLTSEQRSRLAELIERVFEIWVIKKSQ